jgi:thiol:disulfide interchange protein DsbD
LVAAGCAVLLTVPLLTGLQARPVAANPEAGTESFSPARLAALRAEGRPVFVNLTAAWCVTCLVNERVAIATQPVRLAFAARHVAYLKGDWTSQDPEITVFLRANGRDGVPLYLYYGPHAAAASVLPQVLTEGTMLAVLDRPSGG